MFFLSLALTPQAVVLACEDGARLYPLTQDYPAALLPVLNKPLLQYQLELLEKAGYTGDISGGFLLFTFYGASTSPSPYCRALRETADTPFCVGNPRELVVLKFTSVFTNTPRLLASRFEQGKRPFGSVTVIALI